MTRLERQTIVDQAVAALYRDEGPEANPYPEDTEEREVWLEAWTDAYEACNPPEDVPF